MQPLRINAKYRGNSTHRTAHTGASRLPKHYHYASHGQLCLWHWNTGPTLSHSAAGKVLCMQCAQVCNLRYTVQVFRCQERNVTAAAHQKQPLADCALLSSTEACGSTDAPWSLTRCSLATSKSRLQGHPQFRTISLEKVKDAGSQSQYWK